MEEGCLKKALNARNRIEQQLLFDLEVFTGPPSRYETTSIQDMAKAHKRKIYLI